MSRFDPFGDFAADVTASLQEALHSLGLAEAVADVGQRLAAPPAEKGDLAYPCFPLAKAARKAPAVVAAEVLAALPPGRRFEAFADGPYVNFRWRPESAVEETLAAVRAQGAAWGRSPPTGRRTIVEHTSANPNGPFHVGRGRNPIVGDTVARLLRAAGDDVTTEYYVNDMGKQVAILAWGLANLAPEDVQAVAGRGPDGEAIPPELRRTKVDHQKVPYYQEANRRMESDPKVAEEVNGLLRRFEAGDEEAAHMFREAAATVLAGMRESLARLNVHLDSFFWESDLVRSGEVAAVVEKLKRSDVAGEEEGAWYLELAGYGIQGKNTKWFFTRRDGTTLYTTRDLAYHENKFRRAERAVNVLGEDHKLTMKQLEAALSIVGVDRTPEVLWISFVSLPEGKMSTRRNRVVFLDDLLDEAVERAYQEVRRRRGEELAEADMRRIADVVGIAALRFNIVAVQAEKGITFRWEDALDFEGASAPFCQYAHARAASILRLVAAEGGAAAAAPRRELLQHPSEVRLAKVVGRLPWFVRQAARELRPHAVTGYCVEVAGAFNDFYRDCPVTRAEPGLKEARVELVAAAATTLKAALDLLGIQAPDAM